MLLQIIQGTPLRVWVLFLGLIVLGVSQARTRTVGSLRAALQPGIFVALSLAGVVSAFGASGVGVAAWATGVFASVTFGPYLLPRLRATWQAANDSLQIAGSWLPLTLILSLFFVKYTAGVGLALHPQWVSESDFIVACSLAYGLFSGLFAARSLQLWQVRRAARA